MITPTDLQRLTDLPIEGVAERLGLHLSHHVALCPFHSDRNPSLHFSTSKNRYHCFVCGAHGSTIDLVMGLLHLKFPDACRWLSDGSLAVVQTPPVEKNVRRDTFARQNQTPISDISILSQLVAQPILTDEAQHFLFDERRLDPRVIRWCRISSTHTHLLIPYFDMEDKLISVQWRRLVNDSTPRFKFPPQSNCSIYNLQILNQLSPSEPLYIAEGCSDCWAMLSAGHKTIAIPSATLLKPEDLTILNSLCARLGTHFHMYPDQDEPGERLFLQLQKQLPLLHRHQLPSDCKDFGQYWAAQKQNTELSTTVIV